MGYHSAEMIYVWHDPTYENCFFGPEEHGLAARMQSMWSNFAKNLNPSLPGSYEYPFGSGEVFPRYTNSSRQAVVFQIGKDAIESDYRGHYCDMWQRLEFKKLLRRRGVSRPNDV